jgi:hypothetical protein
MGKAIINLQAGLGNRLFQISFIYAYAKRNGLNFGYFSKGFNPHTKIDYHEKVYPFIEFSIPNGNFVYYNEPCNKYMSFETIPVYENVVFSGYFQCDKYFKDFKSDIQNIFQFPKLEGIKEKSIFIHVRRGDWVGSKSDIDLSEYYKTAINFIRFKNPSIENVYVISDDFEYCFQNKIFKDQFIDISIEYVSMNELETMELMRNCKYGGICSNSTFSWWGGYLNKSDEKVIIFPGKWRCDLLDVIPNEIAFEGSYIVDFENYSVKQII